MNSAIIVAAGKGTRTGLETPKQFHEISGKPLLYHTIEKFEKCDAIGEIVVVTSRENCDRIAAKTTAKVVAGGETRAESVRNGLAAVSANAEIIAVHDAARPFVSVEEITATVREAREFGSACLCAAVSDTIKEVGDGVIIATIDRRKLRRALTPQCFQAKILRKAFSDENFDGAATDECYLVEKLGFKIRAVEGSAANFKITTAEDLKIAEVLLK